MMQRSRMIFKPIEKTTIPSEIVDQVLSMLFVGDLKGGDRLPSERELCEALNVGRSSVREAMKALETLGIVRRDNRGTVVSSTEENSISTLSLAASGATFDDALELSRILAVEMAGMAAKRASREHVENMAATLRNSEDAQEAAAIVLSFQRALLQAVQNPALSQVYSMIIGLMSQTDTLSLVKSNLEESKLKAVISNSLDANRRVLEAIKSHDVSAARTRMREYFDYFEREALGKGNNHENNGLSSARRR